MSLAAAYAWFGPPQLEQIESRIARGRMDAYTRLLGAEGLPRGLHDRVLDLLVRGNLLTRGAMTRLQKLRGAVARVRNAHTSGDLATRSLLSVHAGLSLLLLDCESYQRQLDERRPESATRAAELTVVAG